MSIRVADVALRVGAGKLTPLEQQVVALKASAGTALLLVEVGYKFVAFGEDAIATAAALDVHAFERGHEVDRGRPALLAALLRHLILSRHGKTPVPDGW